MAIYSNILKLSADQISARLKEHHKIHLATIVCAINVYQRLPSGESVQVKSKTTLSYTLHIRDETRDQGSCALCHRGATPATACYGWIACTLQHYRQRWAD